MLIQTAEAPALDADNQTVADGVAAWIAIQEDTHGQRERWRRVGAALSVGRKLHKNNRDFGAWCNRSGFMFTTASTRSNAMWLAANWSLVAATTLESGVSHPDNIRQHFREVAKAAAAAVEPQAKVKPEKSPPQAHTESKGAEAWAAYQACMESNPAGRKVLAAIKGLPVPPEITPEELAREVALSQALEAWRDAQENVASFTDTYRIKALGADCPDPSEIAAELTRNIASAQKWQTYADQLLAKAIAIAK